VGVSSLALAATFSLFHSGSPASNRAEAIPVNLLLSRDSGSAPGNSSTPPVQTSVSDLEATVAAAPQITDSSQIDALNQKLYNQVNQAWKTRSTVEQDLIYRGCDC